MGAIAPESSQVRPGFAGKVRYRKLKSNPLAGSHTPRGQGARKRRVWESLVVRSSTSFEKLFLRRNPGRRDAVIGYVLIHLCYLKALDGVLAWSQARIISATVSSASGDNFVWGSLTYHHGLGCKLAPGLSPSRAIHAGLCRGSTTGLSERDVTLIPGGMKGVESGISTLERNQLFCRLRTVSTGFLPSMEEISALRDISELTSKFSIDWTLQTSEKVLC